MNWLSFPSSWSLTLRRAFSFMFLSLTTASSVPSHPGERIEHSRRSLESQISDNPGERMEHSRRSLESQVSDNGESSSSNLIVSAESVSSVSSSCVPWEFEAFFECSDVLTSRLMEKGRSISNQGCGAELVERREMAKPAFSSPSSSASPACLLRRSGGSGCKYGRCFI